MFKKLRVFTAAALFWAGWTEQAASESTPDINLILEGHYTAYTNDSDYELPGFMLGGKAGRDEKGFQLGDSELLLSGDINDMFYGKMTTLITDRDRENEVTLKEAYIKTQSLIDASTIQAGRFLSGIGYLNNQPSYSWDFADAPLVYRAMFGDTLFDDGIQISRLTSTAIYYKLGAEVTRGARFPAGGATHNGAGAKAVFIKLGGDTGTGHSWQLGLSHWQAEIEGRLTDTPPYSENPIITSSYSGDTTINGIDFIWTQAPNGNSQEDSLTLQAEYFRRDEDGIVDILDGSTRAIVKSSHYSGRQSGWYAQAIYRFIAHWRAGLRYDQLGSNNHGNDPLVLAGAGLDDKGQHPRRTTLMLEYAPSKQSRLRLQYAYDESYAENDGVIILQYVMNLKYSKGPATLR